MGELETSGRVDELENVMILACERVGEGGVEGGVVGGDFADACPEGIAHEDMADPEFTPHAEGVVVDFVEVGLEVGTQSGGDDEVGVGDVMVGEDEIKVVSVEAFVFEDGNAVVSDVFFEGFGDGVVAHEVHVEGFKVMAGEQGTVEGKESGEQEKHAGFEGGHDCGGDEAEGGGVEEGALPALEDGGGVGLPEGVLKGTKLKGVGGLDEESAEAEKGGGYGQSEGEAFAKFWGGGEETLGSEGGENTEEQLENLEEFVGVPDGADERQAVKEGIEGGKFSGGEEEGHECGDRPKAAFSAAGMGEEGEEGEGDGEESEVGAFELKVGEAFFRDVPFGGLAHDAGVGMGVVSGPSA